MRNSWVLLMMCVVARVVDSSNTRKECAKGLSTSKLVCYYSTLDEIQGCYCTHVVLPASADVKAVEGLKSRVKGVKVYVSVNEFNQGLIDLLKKTKIDGLEVNLNKLDSKHDISDFISTIKTKIGTDLEIAISVPPKAELLAKYFDFKALSKRADLFILQTAFLGASANVTFHPSRLSGMWDMQNTDSVVDLVSGLGAPLSKLVITAPVQAYQFTLQDQEYTAPGSPALEVKSLDRNELCRIMRESPDWTLERDEDRAGPYIFSKDQWVAFDDSKSVDIKAKYSRIRGLAGMALKDLSQDGGTQCGSTILEAVYNGLSTQSRAPRGAVFHSLEREIVDGSAKPLNSVHLSPFSISRIIDTEGKIHVVRQDSRTEFKCSRQGYFVHPRSCNRFYRCVKFNQLTDDYNVFEFDCPAGLAFDERVEVCVWPGSLPHGTPCSGSSEIAPVPRGRFECPSEPGYYADPENCRWFFACLDHGKSSLTPYEFRCPFGLVFDGDRLVCEWPWLVPKCVNGLGVNQDTQYYYGASNDLQGLQNYDGLGILGTIKLGGVTGTIQKPIATIYSNADNSALGLGYQNSGGYIEGSGLSYKAAQSLQTAGLLKVNNGVVYQTASGADGQYQNQEYSGSGYNLQNGYVGSNIGDGYEFGGSQEERTVKNSGGVAGSVNIIGGGYSAVGTLSGVDVSHNGQGGSNVLTVTEHPLDRVAPIPTVTAVPVPGIKTVAGFDTVRGGVIANVPELQFKVKTLEDAGLFNNLSTSYVNVVVPPSTYHQLNGAGGYEYENKNLKSFEESGLNGIIVSTSRPFTAATTPASQIYVSTTSGYVSTDSPPSKSTVNLYQQPIQTYISNKLPQTAYTYQNIAQQAVGVYSYPRPAVELQQTSIYSSTPRPSVGAEPAIVSSYFNLDSSKSQETQHPTVTGYYNLKNSNMAAAQQNYIGYASSKPAEISYNYVSSTTPKTSVGYVYPQPDVKFVEGNSYYNLQTDKGAVSQQILENVQTYVTPKPVDVQPAVVTYSTPKPSAGYVYTKPAIKFEETPVVSSYFNLQNSNKASGLQNLEYALHSYVTPKSVEVQPTVATYSTPKPSEGYVYTKPAIKFEETPVVSSYFNLKNSNEASSQQNLEYASHSYVTPKPVEVQPAVVTYSTPKPNAGYVYSKPAIKFGETPVVSSYFNLQNSNEASGQQNLEYASHSYVTPKPVEVQPPVGFYSTSKPSAGYIYTKPLVKFEETPVASSYFNLQNSVKSEEQQNLDYASISYVTPKPVELQPAVVSYKAPEPSAGYVYTKPAAKFEQTPVVNSYFNLQNSNAASGQQTIEYGSHTVTPKPIEVLSYSTPKTLVKETNVGYEAPVVSSYFNLYNPKEIAGPQNLEYSYTKPAVVNSYSYVTPTTPKSIIVQPAAISYSPVKPNASYIYQQNSYSYVTPKPVLSQETNVGYVYPKPDIEYKEQPVVSSYFNLQNSKAEGKYSNSKNRGYVYAKPVIKFEETPTVTYTTPQPELVRPAVVDEGYVYSKPELKFETKPAVVSSYFNLQNSKSSKEYSNSESGGYVYTQPAVKFEQPTPLVTYSSTPRPEVSTASVGYAYPKPAVKFEETPAVVNSYFNLQSSNAAQVKNQLKYSIGNSYDYVAPVTAKPAVVTSYFNIGSSTPKPQAVAYEIPEVNYIPSTTVKPQPAIVNSYFNLQSSKAVEQQNQVKYSYDYVTPTTVKPIVQHQPAVVTSYFNIGSSTPKLVEVNTPTTTRPVLVEHKPAIVTSYFNQQPSKGYEYPKPAVGFEEVREVPFVKKTAYVTGNYQQNEQGRYDYAQNYQQNGKVVVENYQIPDYERVKQVVIDKVQYQQPQVVLNYVETTPRPSFVSTVKTIATKKLQPVTPAVVTYYDSRYTSTPRPYITSTAPTPEVVVSTTSRPVSRYSFSSLDDQYQYNNIIKSSTYQPSREYLPVTSTVRTTSPQIFKVVENFVAPEVTTLARDYLPVLPVKVTTPSREYLPVGTTSTPEITTLSREYLPVKTRLKITSTTEAPQPQRVTVTRPVTVIKTNDAHPLLSAKLGAQCTCVSNKLTLRRKQKIIIVEDTENDDNLDDYEPQKVVEQVIPTTERIVKIRPPVTHVSELFYQKDQTESTPSDRDIVKAVRTGLKLVKQAAKEGAKEGTREELSRYGQGTIDCQRAGLFRHPTQCNKFYSCRWDCTKKKFTLHVFNCPVHLTFDNSLGACNWPSQGPACVENTLITSD